MRDPTATPAFARPAASAADRLRRCLRNAAAVLAGLAFFVPAPVAECGAPAPDYARLLDLIALEDQQQPLYAFDEFEDQFDPDGHRLFLQYFNAHPRLVKKIKTDLGASRLNWKLNSLEKRLLFVPENRPEYAALYYRYCSEAIDFILHAARLDNPYAALVTLDAEKPEIHPAGGITVFLVHNLAREYRGTYRFFAEAEAEEVEIALNSRTFIGEVGSYTSILEFGERGAIDFVHRPYTIWQNSANSAYNALIVPLEETLHIGLRAYTEKMIGARLREQNIDSLQEAEKLVRHWTAVEEAVVGGLVAAYFPRLAHSIALEIEPEAFESAIRARTGSGKYRYLRSGIEAVKVLGETEALEMYRSDPEEFYRRLLAEEDV